LLPCCISPDYIAPTPNDKPPLPLAKKLNQQRSFFVFGLVVEEFEKLTQELVKNLDFFRTKMRFDLFFPFMYLPSMTVIVAAKIVVAAVIKETTTVGFALTNAFHVARRRLTAIQTPNPITITPRTGGANFFSRDSIYATSRLGLATGC
jgi:hypothetical protein